MPDAALVLRIQDEWVRVPALEVLLLSMWKQALTIKHGITPTGCSRGMDTEGKSRPRPPASPGEGEQHLLPSCTFYTYT